LAALTIASTACVVMSPRTTVMRVVMAAEDAPFVDS
jgi:hypothetical protein